MNIFKLHSSLEAVKNLDAAINQVKVNSFDSNILDFSVFYLSGPTRENLKKVCVEVGKIAIDNSIKINLHLANSPQYVVA